MTDFLMTAIGFAVLGFVAGFAFTVNAMDRTMKARILRCGRYDIDRDTRIVGHIETRMIEEKWERVE